MGTPGLSVSESPLHLNLQGYQDLSTRTSPPAPCLSAPAPTALPEPSASMAAPAAVEPASPHPPLGECLVHQPPPARASTCLMGSGWTSMSAPTRRPPCRTSTTVWPL